MFSVIVLIFFSVFIISIISLIGICSLLLQKRALHRFLLLFVSFAAGTLLGDVFFHLLPEAAEKSFSS